MIVATLYFDFDADAALTRLERDPQRRALAAAMDRVLLRLETHPGDASLRRNRFTNGLWAISVSGSGEDWFVLWEPHPDEADGVVVQYVGPAPSR